MFHEVVMVNPSDDYSVCVTFEDGKTVLYDVKPLLNKPVFEPLKDLSYFVSSCKVMNGTLAWDIAGNGDTTKCVDIDPEMLYSLCTVE